MFGKKVEKGYKAEQLDMTAMVDVMFQLMTFLLLTYQVSIEPEVEVPVAQTGQNVDEADSVLLIVAPPLEAGGQARVYDSPELDPTRLLDHPDSIKAAVEHGLAAGKRSVVIAADGEVPWGEVQRVAGIAGEVEGVTLHIGVEEPKGSK
jgi:biopolymer transport protein ExbD